jgi:hypothetical protein
MEASYWEAASTRRVFLVFILLLALLLGAAAGSVLTCALWATAIGVLYSLALPIMCYTDARAYHKGRARFAVLFAFFLPLQHVAYFYGPRWTPYSLLPFAMLQLVLSAIFAGSISTIVCERFVKPRLKPKAVPTNRHQA